MRPTFLVLSILVTVFLSFFVKSKNEFNYLPENNGNIIHHKNFSLLYDEGCEQAKWVAYELTSEELKATQKRTDNFREDTLIKTRSSILADFKGSGLDRGHLAPAADMRMSYESMSESFLLSNVSPQRPGFNRGIWRKLESKVRSWATAHGSVYIVTGGDLNNVIDTIGVSDVCVPAAYFKALLVRKDDVLEGAGFYLPNEKSDQPLDSFIMSLDELESKLQINFFSELQDTLESEVERSVDLSFWFE